MIYWLPSRNRMYSNCWKLQREEDPGRPISTRRRRRRIPGAAGERLVIDHAASIQSVIFNKENNENIYERLEKMNIYLSIYGLPGLFKTKMKNTIKKSKWKGKWKSPCTQFSPALLPAFAHWPTPADKKTCPALSSRWSPYKSVNATNLYWLSQMIFFIKASRTWTSFP